MFKRTKVWVTEAEARWLRSYNARTDAVAEAVERGFMHLAEVMRANGIISAEALETGLEKVARGIAGRPLEDVPEEEIEANATDSAFNDWLTEKDLDIRDRYIVEAAREAWLKNAPTFGEGEVPEQVMEEFGLPREAWG